MQHLNCKKKYYVLPILKVFKYFRKNDSINYSLALVLRPIPFKEPQHTTKEDKQPFNCTAFV